MHVSFTVKILGASLAFFLALLLCMRLGGWLARRLKQRDGGVPSVNPVEASIFGLLGLLVAFTFYGAAGRFEARHDMAVREVAAILTAWERLSLLPDSTQPAIREQFRRYLDSRLEVYKLAGDADKFSLAVGEAHVQIDRLWSLALAATEGRRDVQGLVLPTISTMRDEALARILASDVHTPPVIYVVLCLLAFASATLVGLDMERSMRSWPHMVIFAGSIALAVYLTIELEFPRQGVVRSDEYDRAVINVRDYLFEEPQR